MATSEVEAIGTSLRCRQSLPSQRLYAAGSHRHVFELIDGHRYPLPSGDLLGQKLFGIVEDDSKRVAVPGSQATDAVAKIHPIESSLTLNRAMVHRKGHGIPLAERDHFRSRLHARTLLGEHELATREVLPWP